MNRFAMKVVLLPTLIAVLTACASTPPSPIVTVHHPDPTNTLVSTDIANPEPTLLPLSALATSVKAADIAFFEGLGFNEEEIFITYTSAGREMRVDPQTRDALYSFDENTKRWLPYNLIEANKIKEIQKGTLIYTYGPGGSFVEAILGAYLADADGETVQVWHVEEGVGVWEKAASNEMPTDISPKLQAIWETAPDLSKEWLSKKSREASFSEYLFYVDSSGEVKAVFWPESDRVVPAMLVNERNLIVSEKVTSPVVLDTANPKKLDKEDLVNSLDFFEKWIAATAQGKKPPLNGEEKVEEFLASYAIPEAGINVRFADAATFTYPPGSPQKIIPVEYLRVSPERGMIYVFTDKPRGNEMLQVVYDSEYSKNYRKGVSIDGSGTDNIIHIYQEGSITFAGQSAAGFRLSEGLETLMRRAAGEPRQLGDSINYKSILDIWLFSYVSGRDDVGSSPIKIQTVQDNLTGE